MKNFFTSVVGMSEPTAKNVKLSNYMEHCIMFVFVSVDSNPICVLNVAPS